MNNAGIFPKGDTAEVDEATFDAAIATNVKAPFFLTAAIAPQMVLRGSGKIINITTREKGINPMSFQSYLQNIKAKTGKGPEDFRRLAAEKGFTSGDTIKDGVKAGDIVAWLKEDFGLGHGHAMAIYALLKGSKSEDSE